MRISRSEGSVTLVVALLVVAMSLVPLFFLANDVFEAIESLLDDASIALQPRVELFERLRSKAVDPLLRDRPDLDEPGVAQNAEVLGHLRLPEAEPLDDFPDRAGLTAQQLDDLEPVRFRQGAQRGLHGPYIPLQAYSCQGIFGFRARRSARARRLFGPNRPGGMTPARPLRAQRAKSAQTGEPPTKSGATSTDGRLLEDGDVRVAAIQRKPGGLPSWDVTTNALTTLSSISKSKPAIRLPVDGSVSADSQCHWSPTHGPWTRWLQNRTTTT